MSNIMRSENISQQTIAKRDLLPGASAVIGPMSNFQAFLAPVICCTGNNLQEKTEPFSEYYFTVTFFLLSLYNDENPPTPLSVFGPMPAMIYFTTIWNIAIHPFCWQDNTVLNFVFQSVGFQTVCFVLYTTTGYDQKTLVEIVGVWKGSKHRALLTPCSQMSSVDNERRLAAKWLSFKNRINSACVFLKIWYLK